MPGPNGFLFLVVPLWFSFPLPMPHSLLAYAGLGPGQELIPYFLALLAWVGAAVGAILLWPVSTLLRRLRRAKGDHKHELKNEPITARVPELPGEESHEMP